MTHTSEFKWASDRTSARAPPPPQRVNNEAAAANTTTTSSSSSSRRGRGTNSLQASSLRAVSQRRLTTTPAADANVNYSGFTWITDDIEQEDEEPAAPPAAHTVQQQQQRQPQQPVPANPTRALRQQAPPPTVRRPLSGSQSQPPARAKQQQRRAGSDAAPAVHAACAAGATAAASAAGAAAACSSWLGGHAGWLLDAVMGYDARLAQPSTASDDAAAQQHQRQHHQQQHPPEAPQPPSSAPGMLLAVAVAVWGIATDAGAAVHTAYSDSLLPAAELLWNVGAVLVLCLLPLLRLLLRAVVLLLQGCGRPLRAVNRSCSRALCSGRLVLFRRGRGGAAAARGCRLPHCDSDMLLEFAQEQLELSLATPSRLNLQGQQLLLPFQELLQSTGTIAPAQQLGACAGYGAAAFAGAAHPGEPAAVQAAVLASARGVARWDMLVSIVSRLPMLAGNSTSDGGSNSELLLQFKGAAVGPAPAEAQDSQQQQQQQKGNTVLGLIALEQLVQPCRLLSALQAATAPPSTLQPAAWLGQLQQWHTRVQLASQLASALHALVCRSTGRFAAAAQPVGAHQLLGAVVVDAAVQPLRLRLNPVLLLAALSGTQHESQASLLELLQQQGARVGVLTTAAAQQSLLEQLQTSLAEVQQQHQVAPISEGRDNEARSLEVSCVQALAGALLLLLSGDSVAGALLAPGSTVDVPVLAQLQAEQRQRVQQLLDQHQAVNLLLLPPERRQLRSLQSPQLSQRVEAVGQRLVGQVLACDRWAAAFFSASGTRLAAPIGGDDNGGSSSLVHQHEPRGDTASTTDDAPRPRFAWGALLRNLQAAEAAAAGAWAQWAQLQDAPPPALLCPIGQVLMTDPVVAADGHTYERKNILQWFQACGERRAAVKSPMTGLLMKVNVVPNHTVRSLVREWQQAHGC